MRSPRQRHVHALVPSEAEMYRAIKERDARYDGVFYYGVVTTGVYCKPSCPSRAAKPENIRLYLDPGAASRAGFRACKRCRPDQALGDLERMVAVARYIDEHFEEQLTLARLSTIFGLSPFRLQKAFTATFGVSPKAYQDARRMGRFKGALKDGESVTAAIYSAGFGSPSRVYGESARSIGMTPAVYRAGGRGQVIHYAYRESSLGPLMMAATSRGVCFAQFGDSESALESQLKAEFPEAELRRSASADGPELSRWIAALDAHLAAQAPRPDLPLDLRGTSLQLQVWRFLLSVREGDVVSYSEVAEGIGRPKAVRAVASACGANRIGVLVPCHRVLRSNGELGGYRWGLDRKRTLLDIESREGA